MAGANDDRVVQAAPESKSGELPIPIAVTAIQPANFGSACAPACAAIPSKLMVDDAPTLGFGVTFDMVVAETACGNRLTLSSHRDDDTNPPHRHVNDYVCIVLTGALAEWRENGWRDFRAGSFFLHRAGETHYDKYGPLGAVCLSLHLSPGQPLPARPEGSCAISARLAADELAFELAAGRREELVLASLAAEIMAQFQPDDANVGRSGVWMNSIIHAMSGEPTRRWTLGDLAGIANRHPVRLAQAFRAKTGMSLGAFQRRQRLINLCMALRHGQSPLAMLASEFGYCDQSHMNSEFRAAVGTSPGRYRESFH